MASPYEIPPFGAPASTLHGWLMNAVAEGQAWLGAQRPAQAWEAVRTRLSTSGAGEQLDNQSNLTYDKVKRVTREIVASLSNFRHEGMYKPTWDGTLYERAGTLTQLDEHWYRVCHANARIREAVQYGVAFGTSYLFETWDKHAHGPFAGDIKLQALAPDCVTFVQLPKDGDIQRAYMTIIREELPINLARAIYGPMNQAFADGLVADRQTPGWLQKGLQKVQQFLSPALRVGGLSQANKTDASFPTVDIFHAFTLDSSVNLTGLPVRMGAVGTNWSYVVPSLGDPINTGQINPATGQPWTRPAEHHDCLLFPLRRYTLYSNTGVGYDGSSPYWHGKTPLTRVRYNDWAWEALGGSIPAEGMSIEDGIVALMRQVEDSGAARLDPPMLYDDQLVSTTFAQAFNPRKAGARAAAQINSGKIVDFPVDPHIYDVPEWISEFIIQQEGRIDYLMAANDMTAIAKAKQIPGADTLEKLMEMAGPIVQDMVRALEEPLQQLGEWRKAMYLQFYTRPRVITITGVKGNMEDVQYTPEQLLPFQRDQTPEQRSGLLKLSVGDFRYEVTESGVNEIHRMTTRLFYLQLMKAGFPIDWWTMAEIAKISNFGAPPEGAKTVLEKWIAQQHVVSELAADAAMDGAAQAPNAGGAPQAGKPGNEQQTQARPGRPNADSAPPKIEQKDGGTRSTVTTS